MSVVDDLASAFETGRKLLTGELSVEELGERVFGGAQKGRCAKGVPCVLEEGHEGDCQALTRLK